MQEILEKFDPAFQSAARQYIHVTTHDKSHKMAGIQSISTSVLDNPICQYRRKVPGTVCEKCYADHLCRYRKSLQNCLSRNLSILSGHLMDQQECLRVPIDTAYARIESFGDVANLTHARNYIRIINANPQTQWGIWSKNLEIWMEAFDIEGKPENCSFVLSSTFLNAPAQLPQFKRAYVDHVFTVWTKDRYDFAGTPTECAGLSCRTCLKCYRRDTPFEINEKLR